MNGATDQPGSVIGDHHLDAFGQTATQFVETLLDLLDCLQGIVVVAHHDDAADHLAFTIQLGHTAARRWPQLHVGNLAQQPWRALRAEERRVGNACVSTCGLRWSRSDSKQNTLTKTSITNYT